MNADRNRIAVITGASSGFGRIFAVELEKNIDLEEIWLIARREDKLIDTGKMLQRVKAVVITADLSTQEGIDIVSRKAEVENPLIKVLINNAGFGRTEEFEKADEEYYNKMIDVNIKVPVIMTKRLIKFMEEGSKIINVASSAAYAPLPYFSVYAATKAFLLSFSYAINEEFKGKDISVTAVCPGPASTEFFKNPLGAVNGLKIYDPEKIVIRALKDSKNGKKVSVYGFQMNFMRFISRTIPRSLLAKIAGRIKYPK